MRVYFFFFLKIDKKGGHNDIMLSRLPVPVPARCVFMGAVADPGGGAEGPAPSPGEKNR